MLERDNVKRSNVRKHLKSINIWNRIRNRVKRIFAVQNAIANISEEQKSNKYNDHFLFRISTFEINMYIQSIYIPNNNNLIPSNNMKSNKKL